VIVLVRGDDEVNEAKVAVAIGTGIFRPAESEEIYAALGAHPGSLGAVGVQDIPIYADEHLRGAAGMTTGANEDGFHQRHVNAARDLPDVQWADLRTVREGELSAGGQPLKIRRAIEVGHVFKLGTKYSEALESSFLTEEGRRQPPVMGCYGLGVTRTLQAVIEVCHDEHGITWPLAVAPWAVCVTPLDVKPDSEVMRAAVALHQELEAAGVEVILDDRDVRPGAKFKDSELVGFPLRVAIGGKSLANGEMEWTVRREGGKAPIKAGEAQARVLEWLATERA
jgi:prolyl-tRNA synthetase